MKWMERLKETVANDSYTIGFGKMTLDDEEENSQVIELDVLLLKRVLDIAETLNWGSFLHFRVEEGMPVLISNEEDATKGILIAPRMPDEAIDRLKESDPDE